VSGFLVDTNIISEVARPRPSQRVVAFLDRTPVEELFLCDVVIAEIRYGLETTTDAARRNRFTTWLETCIRPNFAGRILPLTEDVFLQWRFLKESGQRSGYTFPEPDLLIAATAAHYGLTVVTRDVEPFERAKVAVFNPWHLN
jgi:predicted nucleic acid-binding protein